MFEERERKKQCKIMVKNNPEITLLECSFNSSAQFQTDFHHLLSCIYGLCRRNQQLNADDKAQDSVSRLPHQEMTHE